MKIYYYFYKKYKGRFKARMKREFNNFTLLFYIEYKHLTLFLDFPVYL